MKETESTCYHTEKVTNGFKVSLFKS